MNCFVLFTRTVAAVGEMVMATGGGAVTFTNAVFETSPSGVLTTTGTDDFGDGALPVAVSFDDDTKVVASATPSNATAEPVTNPTPFTVIVKFPAGTGDGLTELMLGSGMIVTDAAPDDVGDAVLVARTVTTAGFGTSDGATY